MTDFALLPLCRANGTVQGFTKVDAADAGWATLHRWQESNGYAVRYEWRDGRTHCIRLSREVLGLPRTSSGVWADHANGDTLDNRRSNLRAVTPLENGQNKRRTIGPCPQPGVYWFAGQKSWGVRCTVNGRRVFVGYFKREQDAIRAAVEFRATHMPFSREALQRETEDGGLMARPATATGMERAALSVN